jgi:cytochrome c oxidase assembly factor CtaG
MNVGVSRRRRRRRFLFGAALATSAVAFSGPVEQFAEELFWVHMAQHVLLLTVAAPLVVLSAPWMSLLRVLPARMLRRVNRSYRQLRPHPLRGLVTPIAAWSAFNVNLVAWHVPVLFDMTLRSTAVHGLEHLLFLATAVVFWAQVIDAPLLRKRMDNLARVLYVSSTAVVGWVLSMALTVAPSAVYSGYSRAAVRRGGISALADQRIAASVMLVPGSIAFLIASLVYLYRWLDDQNPEMRSPARGRIGPAHKEQPA